MAAQRLGKAFDRGRVPEAVRQLLADFDRRPQEIPAFAEALVERLAGSSAARQVVERALAPQKQIIDREVQRMAVQRGRGGYER